MNIIRRYQQKKAGMTANKYLNISLSNILGSTEMNDWLKYSWVFPASEIITTFIPGTNIIKYQVPRINVIIIQKQRKNLSVMFP